MPSIEVNSASVHFAGQSQPTLDDINLIIPDDGITVIIGPSGCGKTTLLNILAGFITPTSGTISSNGQTISAPGSDRVVVFQDDALMPWLNVAENVALGLNIAGTDKTTRQQRVTEKLQQVGLENVANKPIWALSGGMRQRVGIARALAVNSQFLLMDEPFGALDAFTREQMQELVLSLWRQHSSGFVLITHDIEEALLLATRLVLMAPYPGRILEILDLDYSQRWRQGESLRHLKADKTFVELRESLFYKLVARSPSQHEVTI